MNAQGQISVNLGAMRHMLRSVGVLGLASHDVGGERCVSVTKSIKYWSALGKLGGQTTQAPKRSERSQHRTVCAFPCLPAAAFKCDAVV
jgi:hypothetical protein